MKIRTTVLAAAIAALAVLDATSAQAQNALPNGTFRGKSAPFVETKFAHYDDTRSRQNLAAGDGSLRLTDATFDSKVVYATSACITGIIPGHPYYFSGWMYLDPGPGTVVHAGFEWRAWSNADCTGTTLQSDLGYPYSSATYGTGWIGIGDGNIAIGGFTLPPATNSVEIRVLMDRISPSGTASVNFDDIFFAPVGLPKCKGKTPTVGGTDGDDGIVAGPGNDVIVAFGGDDFIAGGAGNDIVCGGAGDDKIYGQDGNDELLGQAGDDELYGMDGDDRLLGAGGADQLFGGDGADKLVGGTKTDTCDGQEGTPDRAVQCEKTFNLP